jgi:hypothetical protein
MGKNQLFVNNNGRHGEKKCVNIFLFFLTKISKNISSFMNLKGNGNGLQFFHMLKITAK